MQVERKNDRMEMPENCDNCGSDVKLKRFSRYGLGYQVEWLCPYCSVAFQKEEVLVRTMAQMFNLLEKRLKQ